LKSAASGTVSMSKNNMLSRRIFSIIASILE
jgi:hypothetical protein